MKRRNYFHKTLRLLLAGMFFITACTPGEKELVSRVENLSSGWKMQASEKLAGVEENSISENGFSDDSWLQASVPGTVLGSMATYGVIEDPYFGINMQSVDIEQFKSPGGFVRLFSFLPAI